MAERLLYFLVQWEDRFMSVIRPKDVVAPKKSMFSYKEGELITAIFQKTTYHDIHPNRKFLLQEAKFPSKHSYIDATAMKATAAIDSQQNSDDAPPPTRAETVEPNTHTETIEPSVETVEPDTPSKVLELEMVEPDTPELVAEGGSSKFMPGPKRALKSSSTNAGTPTKRIDMSDSVRRSPRITTTVDGTDSFQYIKRKETAKTDLYKEKIEQLEEDVRSIRRKYRRLEERVNQLEKSTRHPPSETPASDQTPAKTPVRTRLLPVSTTQRLLLVTTRLLNQLTQTSYLQTTSIFLPKLWKQL